MKHSILVLILCVTALRLAAAEGVLQKLPADRFARAGLQKLTPAELAELEQVIREAKSGELEVAEKKVAAAEAKARDAEAKAAAAATAADPTEKKGPSWLRALLTLQETTDKPEAADAIESTLVGDYDGWSGRTNFKLANGQIWQQSAPGQRFDDRRTSPKVKVYPGMLGTYWLEIEGVRERVKVKPIRLQ